MKFFTKLFLFFAFSYQLSFAQCFREAPFQDGPDYTLDGTASLTFLLNGTKTLSFDSNFSTPAGPDLHVYLSESATVNTPGGVLQTPNTLDLGLLKSANGTQTYDLTNLNPAVTLASYTYVIIHCKEFNHYWGTGTFGTNQGADCSNLSVKEEIFQNLRIYPTIANKKEIFIELPNAQNTLVNILSITGQNIKKPVILTDIKNRIDLATLGTGIYFIQISQNKNTITKKIIIP